MRLSTNQWLKNTASNWKSTLWWKLNVYEYVNVDLGPPIQSPMVPCSRIDHGKMSRKGAFSRWPSAGFKILMGHLADDPSALPLSKGLQALKELGTLAETASPNPANHCLGTFRFPERPRRGCSEDSGTRNLEGDQQRSNQASLVWLNGLEQP